MSGWHWFLLGLAMAANAVGMCFVWKRAAALWGKPTLPWLVVAVAVIAGIAIFMPSWQMMLSLALAPVVIHIKIRMVEKARERERALASLAGELGLAFSVGDSTQLVRRYAAFELLRRGKDQAASNVLQGRHAGRKVVAFDFQYVTGGGDNRRNHRLSVVVLTAAGSLGDLLIRPEKLGDKLKASVGAGDINFESHEFSSRYFVNARDRKLAYDVISPQVMDHLLANQGWTIEACGCDVMITDGQVLTPERFCEALGVIEGFLDRVPRFVWKELGEAREAREAKGTS